MGQQLKQQLAEKVCATEKRKWVRIIEAVFTVLPCYLGVVLIIYLPKLSENILLEFGIWCGILFSPILCVQFLIWLSNADIPIVYVSATSCTHLNDLQM